MLIAITGCIGSGKSFLLNKIKTIYGYQTYSCDDFVIKAYENEVIKQKLDEQFHCLNNGVIDKEIIKNKLNDTTIKILNSIIHPYVIEQIQNKNTDSLVFIEVPLLFEENLQKYFDFTIAIDIKNELRHKRLKNRDVNNYKNMLKLEKYQFDNDTKVSKADFVISNSTDDLKQYLENLDKIIKQIKI